MGEDNDNVEADDWLGPSDEVEPHGLLFVARRWFGWAVVAVGVIVWIVSGLWGLLVSMAIVERVAGAWVMIISFMFFPIVLALAPWYAGLVWGDWLLVVVVYGGMIGGGIAIGLGKLIAAD